MGGVGRWEEGVFFVDDTATAGSDTLARDDAQKKGEVEKEGGKWRRKGECKRKGESGGGRGSPELKGRQAGGCSILRGKKKMMWEVGYACGDRYVDQNAFVSFEPATYSSSFAL